MKKTDIINKRVRMCDSEIGYVYGIVTDYKEFDTAGSGVVTGSGYPQVFVEIEAPSKVSGWLPVSHVEIVEDRCKRKVKEVN